MNERKWWRRNLSSVKPTWALIAIGLWLLFGYLLLVLVMGESILGIYWSPRFTLLVLMLSLGSIYFVLIWLKQKGWVSTHRLKDAGLFSAITLFSVLGIDLAYGIYSNAYIPSIEDVQEQVELDEQVWHGEIYPRAYYPTAKNFRLYKPNVSVSGTLYGQFYVPELRKSPTLNSSVLESRQQTFIIDEHGFRETTPLEDARVFALGDSYTFGENVSQEKVWVQVLEERTGQPTYNLGISFSSPKQQLLLLQHLFETKGDFIHIDNLIWMCFEGNDLEETYQADIPTISKSALDGTVVDAVASVPKAIRSNSILHKWETGDLKSPVVRASIGEVSNPYLVDGVLLANPLFKSNVHGYKMFRPEYIGRATKPESYVKNHPNLPKLEQTFADMQALSEEHNFKVTVVIAPSAPRLYGPYFEEFPEISKEPYFINYLEDLSGRMEFQTINLYELMAPYAETELLYARDDSHWNDVGNRIAGELIADHMFAQ